MALWLVYLSFESRLSGLVHALAGDSVMFLAKTLTLVRQCLPLPPPRCIGKWVLANEMPGKLCNGLVSHPVTGWSGNTPSHFMLQ